MIRLLATLALALVFAIPALAAPQYLDKSRLRVVDGDTIAYRGKLIRIVGLNAPELRGACPEEKALGKDAKAHAKGLVDGAKIIQAWFAHKKRRDGVIVRDTDKYGRALAQISIDHEDWAQLMIEAKLAQPWDGHGPKPSWCPSPK